MGFLSLQNVSKQYGSTRVVSQFSLEVNKGEFVSLLGPSGCGKTTTLQDALFIEGSDSPYVEGVRHVWRGATR